MSKGSLVIVGTGIMTPAHLSQESINRIETADIVHLLVPDPLGLSTIMKLNKNIKNLADLYYDPKSDKNGNNRLEAYELMVDAILSDVRKGLKVCAIFYGHPGVFVYPSHQCINIAKNEGFEATMLPAISAEDCLFADLGIDPGRLGCQSYETSQFLFYQHTINRYSALILWQVGIVGDTSLTQLRPTINGLKMLKDKLLKTYPISHRLTIYEATTLPIMPPRVEFTQLQYLDSIDVKAITTLYIPPVDKPAINFDFCKKWKINTHNL